MTVFQVHDAQPLTFRTESPVDEPLSVRRIGWKAVVVGPGCDFANARTVRLDYRDLCTLRAISEVLAQSEENRIALRGPIGRLRELPILLKQSLRHIPPRLDVD